MRFFFFAFTLDNYEHTPNGYYAHKLDFGSQSEKGFDCVSTKKLNSAEG